MLPEMVEVRRVCEEKMVEAMLKTKELQNERGNYRHLECVKFSACLLNSSVAMNVLSSRLCHVFSSCSSANLNEKAVWWQGVPA